MSLRKTKSRTKRATFPQRRRRWQIIVFKSGAAPQMSLFSSAGSSLRLPFNLSLGFSHAAHFLILSSFCLCFLVFAASVVTLSLAPSSPFLSLPLLSSSLSVLSAHHILWSGCFFTSLTSDALFGSPTTEDFSGSLWLFAENSLPCLAAVLLPVITAGQQSRNPSGQS